MLQILMVAYFLFYNSWNSFTHQHGLTSDLTLCVRAHPKHVCSALPVCKYQSLAIQSSPLLGDTRMGTQEQHVHDHPNAEGGGPLRYPPSCVWAASVPYSTSITYYAQQTRSHLLWGN